MKKWGLNLWIIIITLLLIGCNLSSCIDQLVVVQDDSAYIEYPVTMGYFESVVDSELHQQLEKGELIQIEEADVIWDSDSHSKVAVVNGMVVIHTSLRLELKDQTVKILIFKFDVPAYDLTFDPRLLVDITMQPTCENGNISFVIRNLEAEVDTEGLKELWPGNILADHLANDKIAEKLPGILEEKVGEKMSQELPTGECYSIYADEGTQTLYVKLYKLYGPDTQKPEANFSYFSVSHQQMEPVKIQISAELRGARNRVCQLGVALWTDEDGEFYSQTFYWDEIYPTSNRYLLEGVYTISQHSVDLGTGSHSLTTESFIKCDDDVAGRSQRRTFMFSNFYHSPYK